MTLPASGPVGVVDVVYVLGLARSGTTLAGRLLAQATGGPPVDELVMALQRGLVEGRPCACGALFGDCPFWSAVAATDPALSDPDRASAVVAGTHRVMAALGPRRVLTGRGRRALRELAGPAWLPTVEALYAGVAAVAGTTRLVDTSKAPALAVLLAGSPRLRLRLVHLVRDPRAVAWSWCRPDDRPGSGDLPHLPPGRTAVVWLLVNAAAERARRVVPGPHARARYEDLIADPTGTVGAVLADLHLEPSAAVRAGVRGPGPADDPVSVPGGGVHSFAGNPSVRLATGPVVVAAPERGGLGAGARAAVTALDLPLLHRYGYGLREAG